MSGAAAREGTTLAIGGQRLGTVLRAPLPGRFLRRHPARQATLTGPGKILRGGEVLGLLAVGPLLIPVLMPADGVVLSILAGDAIVVGHGEALADVVTLAELEALGISP